MEIEILNTHKNDFSPVIGERTMELLSRFGQKLDEDGIDTLSSETIEILSHCTNPYKNEVQSVTNLVVGYVQSGKTMSFTTLSALAHDNGFRIIIYFAGTKNNLLSQTTKRLRKDLINGSANSAYYKLFENPTLEYAQRIRNALNISSKPTILITVLKHHKYISDLAAMFNSMQLKQTLGKAGVLIIDDEADQASLNGYAYKNSKSEEWEDDEYTTTYSSIMKLKGALANHSYIQYTATPQGPLLISIMDLLSPKHHTVLTPGKTYTGGKTDEAAGVALTFGHRLSQIEIKAKNTNDGYVYKVQGVRIGQPVSKATFDFGTTSWQLGSVKTNYEATYAGSEKTLTGTAASIMAEEDDNAMLIPQQLIAWTPDTDKTNTNKGAYLAVKVNITTKDGARVYPSVGEYDWVAVAVNTKWEPGQKYVYTLDFSNGAGKVDPEKPMPGPTDPFKPGEDVLGSAIKFTVTVTPWTSASENVPM